MDKEEEIGRKFQRIKVELAYMAEDIKNLITSIRENPNQQLPPRYETLVSSENKIAELTVWLEQIIKFIN